MASFPITRAVLKRAVSRMPMSTIQVTSSTMPKAGRLKMIRRPASWGAVCQASASCSTLASSLVGSRWAACALATWAAACIAERKSVPSQAGRWMWRPSSKHLEIARPGDRHGGVADGVFEDQVPADEPGGQFAQRGVGIGIGRAGDRHHGRELGVAERGEPAGHRHDEEGNHQRRPGADVLRAAGGGGAGRGEDARADDGAHPEHGELQRAQRAAQLMPRVGGFADQLVEGFAAEESGRQHRKASQRNWVGG